MHLGGYLLLSLGGFAAGVLNTIAGGGSLIVLPLMIVLGVPPNVANGTNRVGVALQNIAAVGTFRRHGITTRGLGPRLLLPATIGALFGTLLAVRIDEALFEKVLGVVVLGMALLIATDSKRWLRSPEAEPRRLTPGLWFAFLAIGAYGGFLQAGTGFFFLAALVLGLRLDLVRANAVKVWVILGYTVLSIGIFLYSGRIDPWVALAASSGQVFGGAVGARLTVKKGARWVRVIVVVAAWAFALKLLGVTRWFGL